MVIEMGARSRSLHQPEIEKAKQPEYKHLRFETNPVADTILYAGSSLASDYVIYQLVESAARYLM